MGKPLFIPLNTEYYNAFKSGEKTYEFRLFGPRWNWETCKKGRPAVLSKGYGKAHRLERVVTSFTVVPLRDLEPTPQGAMRKVYAHKNVNDETLIAVIGLPAPQTKDEDNG